MKLHIYKQTWYEQRKYSHTQTKAKLQTWFKHIFAIQSENGLGAILPIPETTLGLRLPLVGMQNRPIFSIHT